MDKIKVPHAKITKTLDQGHGRFLCQGVTLEKKEKVIIEVFSVKEGASKGDVSELLERVDLYKQINHPNISKFIDGGDLPDDGGAFLSIEMEDEVRLIDRLKNDEWLSPKEATALMIDLARALEEVHRLGVVHGELRPSNILFSPETGHVKLRNIFRYKHEKEYVLKMVSRRPEYASPEQIRFTEIDHRSDMYSLGLIYYQMLTGHLPFKGKNLEEIWRYHLEGGIPVLSEDLQNVKGLQDMIARLLQRRRKARFETDKDLIFELESIYDHMFVEEESSMGRAVTLETSKQHREEKKKKGKPHFDPKGSRRMKKEEEPDQTWSKGERRRLKQNHSRRLTQIKVEAEQVEEVKKQRAQMKGPIIFAGVAFFILLVVTKIFYQSPEIEQSEFAKQPEVIENVPESKKEPKPEVKNDPEAVVSTTTKEPAISLQDAMKKKKKSSSETKTAVQIPEKFDSKLDEVKFYGKLPPEQALKKLELFLDDEEMSVRMLAVQLYQELKHKTFKVDENVEGMSEFELMKLKLFSEAKDKPFELVESLAKDPTPDQIRILEMALDHSLEKVRNKALENLSNNPNEQTFLVVAERVKANPESDQYVEALVKFGPKYISNINQYIDKNGDDSTLKFLKPLLLMEGTHLLTLFTDWAEKRPSVALHIAMELAQQGAGGVQNLIDLFSNTKKDSLALTYLSALREAELNVDQLQSLKSLLVTNLNDTKKKHLIRLLSLREPNSGLLKDETGAEQQAVTLMFISEMKNPPSDIELQRLVELLGASSKSIDERIVSTLEQESSRSYKYLMPAIKNRLSDEIKIRLIQIMASYGDEETLSQLLSLSSSTSTLSTDLKTLIYKKLFLSGDKLIPIALQSKLNLKEKINLLIDLGSSPSEKALIEYLGTMKSVEFKKAYGFILDRGELAQPIIEKILVHPFEDEIKISVLKTLQKSKLNISPNLYVNFMNSENSKVRDEVYEIFEAKLKPDDPTWPLLYDQAKPISSKEFILKQVGAECEGYSSIIYKGISEEDEDLRIAAFEKLTDTPLKEEYNSGITNKLYEEKNKKALALLINHLLKKPGGPSLPYCIWSRTNGSKTIRKITDAELAKVSTDMAKVDRLKGYLIEDYHLELRIEMLKFLNQIKVDYLPYLFDNTNINDNTALELLKQGVAIQSKKSAPVLLAKLSETKNAQLKKVIESMLGDLKISYRLDPESGKYILK